MMGTYKVILSPIAQSDIEKVEKSGQKSTYKKILVLLDELSQHPHFGTGQPELLRNTENQLWSRRVDKKNRMVYSIKENIVTVHVFSILGHYEDK